MSNLMLIGTFIRPLRMAMKRDLKEKELSRLDENIIKILASIAIKNKKRICYPRIITIQNLLWKYYQIKRERRCIAYHFRILEAKGYLTIRPRCRRNKDGQYKGKSSLYIICNKAIKFLNGIVKQSLIWITKMPKIFKQSFKGLQLETLDFAKKQINLEWQEIINKKKKPYRA